MDIEQVLQKAGYQTVSGADAVIDAIKQAAESGGTPLCSGYGVFPDGTKCKGCKDCS